MNSPNYNKMKRIFSDIQEYEDEGNVNDESDSIKKKYESKTGATLFLIDARKKMMSVFDQEKSAFALSLECVRNCIRNKIFKEEKWYCGIILLGTKIKNNSLNLNNLTVIQELSLIGVEHILKIDRIIKGFENSYKNEYGFDNFLLGDAFWLSNQIFNERSQKLNKSIKLFTNDDSGVTNEKNDYNRTMAIARDMYKNYINFDVIHLGKDFDGNKFYKKVLEASHNDVNYIIPDPVITLKEMEKRTNKTNYEHAFLEKIPFVIGEGFQIGVSIHFLVKKMKIPFKVKLSKSTNEKVITKMQLFETETGSLVDKDDIVKSQVVGQKGINFNLRELKTISQFGKVELKLMGFKPASVISIENFVKPCCFIYPDESTYKGSSVFFAALLRRCIVKQVVPICTLCLRTTSASRFVALIAQNENSKTGNHVDLPQGFIVFFLPFAEEIRSFDDNPTKRADSDQVEIAMKLIKKLKFKYKVECFQNPRLKTHWAAIEALALDSEEKESVNDSTYPNYELISQRTGEIANEFIEAVYPNDYDPEICGAPKKPKSSVVKSNPEINIEHVEELIREGKGERLTNDVLKAYLKSVGDGKGLSKIKKSDLLEKVQKHLNLN